LGIATNLLQLNSPIMSFLSKIHTRLSILTDKSGNIPVNFLLNKAEHFFRPSAKINCVRQVSNRTWICTLLAYFHFLQRLMGNVHYTVD